MNQRASTLWLAVFLLILFASPAESQVGRGRFGFGISGIGNMLQSNWKSSDIGYGASADVSYSLGDNWGLLSSLGFDSFSGKGPDNLKVLSTAFHGELTVSYDVVPNETVSPYLFAGGGLMFYFPRVDNGPALLGRKDRPWDVCVAGGLGLDCHLSESWSMIIAAEAGLVGSANIDGYATGANAIFQRVSLGVRYYLFDRSTVQRIVDEVRK